MAGAAVLLTILVGGQARVRTQAVTIWQFENVAQGDFPDNCVRGMTVAGFEYGPDGRPVIAWREENDCGVKPRVYWTRQDAGLWQQSEFLSSRRYGGGAPGDYAHQLALRKSDGAPFLIYADVGSFNEINTYRDDLNAYSNGIASSTYLEGLAGPQNCAGVNYSLAFGPSDVTPQWSTGLANCSFGGPVRLNGIGINNSVYKPTSSLAVGADGTRHLLWINDSSVFYTRWPASATTPDAPRQLFAGNTSNNGEGRIAIADDGTLHAVVRGPDIVADFDQGAIAYLQSVDGGATWSPWEYVDPRDRRDLYNINTDLSLAVDANGVPSVTYWRGRSELWYARRDGPGGTWTQQLVTSLPVQNLIRTNQLRFDPGGQPVIAFSDPVTKSLRLARPVPSGVSIPVDVAVTARVTPSVLRAGGAVTYTLAVTNKGTTNLDRVRLANRLPDGATLVSASPAVGSDGLWTFPVTSGGTTTVTVSATAPSSEGWFVDVASVSIDAVDDRPEDNAAIAAVQVRSEQCFLTPSLPACAAAPPSNGTDVAVTVQSTPAAVITNGIATFEIGVTNSGSVDLPAVTINSQLSGGAILADTAPGPSSTAGNSRDFDLGPLARGERKWVAIRVIALSLPGQISVRAQHVVAGDVNPSNDSATGVVRVMADACVVPPTGLVARWRADGNANDNAGSHDGTFDGVPTFELGRIGSAFSFDGTSQYVSVPDAPELRPTEFTVSAWINPRSVRVGGYDVVVSAARGFWLGISSGYPTLYTNALGVITRAPRLLSLNQWHQLAATYDGVRARLFVDGVNVAETVVNAPMTYGGAELFGIGGYWYNDRLQDYQLFNGLIDDVTLHERALTATELQVMFAGSSSTCAINQAPVAVDDRYEIAFASRAQTLDVLSNDTDADGDRLTVDAIISQPRFGDASVDRDGRSLSYRSYDTYPGSDSLTYRVTDGQGGTSVATVTFFTPPALTADLRVTVSGPVQTALGYPQLTVTVTNTGPTTATGVYLTGFTNDGTFLQPRVVNPAAGESCLDDTAQWSCRFESLARGEQRSVQVYASLLDLVTVDINTTYFANGDQVDPDFSNNVVYLPVSLGLTAEPNFFAHGALSWERDPSYVSATESKFRITFDGSFLRSYVWDFTPPYVGMSVRNVLALQGQGAGLFSFYETPTLTVTSVNRVDDYFTGTATTDVIIPNAALPVSVVGSNCCRLAALQDGNAALPYRLATVIDPSKGPRSPTTTVVPRIYATANQPLEIALPATAYDGLTNTFAVAETTDSRLTTSYPAGMSISSTGVVQWTPAAAGLYAVQLLITSRDGSGVEQNTTPVSVIFQVAPDCGQSCPRVEFTAPATTSFDAYIGRELSFDVTASMLDAPGYVAGLSSPSLPAGASLTPIVSGATTTARFRWTPAPFDTDGVTPITGALVCLQAFGTAGFGSIAGAGQRCVTITVRSAPLMTLSGTIRAFTPAHPDFASPDGDQGAVIVAPTLGADRKPLFAPGGPLTTIDGPSTFDEWWTNGAGRVDTPYGLTLSNGLQSDPRVFVFESTAFRPIAQEFFSFEGHGFIPYVPGDILRFVSADDLWVFVNGTLVVDLGGVHAPADADVALDARAAELGLAPGAPFAIDVFYAHRGLHDAALTVQLPAGLEDLAPFTVASNVPVWAGQITAELPASPLASFTQAVNVWNGVAPPGSTVRLTAHPALGYTFVGWEGACAGNATCTITLSSAGTEVLARFSRPSTSDVNVATSSDQPITIVVNGTDPEGDELTAELVDGGAVGGRVVQTGPMTFEFTPDLAFSGRALFLFRVRDAGGFSEAVTANIQVTLATTVYVNVVERIMVTDGVAVSPAVMVNVAEAIRVTDSIGLSPAVMVNVIEQVRVVDSIETRVGNTPVGTNVTVAAQGPAGTTSPISVTLAQVTQPGNTTYVEQPGGLPPPDGFRFGTPAVIFDISTTALYVAPVRVCINYGPTVYRRPQSIRLFHYEGGQWVDRTISVNTTTRIACASVSSLSPFAIAEPEDLEGRMNGAGGVEAGGREYRFHFRISERRVGTERGAIGVTIETPKSGKKKRAHDEFRSTDIEDINFWDDPAFRPGRWNRLRPLVDSAAFTGTGKWNGKHGYSFEARATDQGEPGRGRDRFTITIRDPQGAVVATVDGVLSDGNIQSERLRQEHWR